jgi:hypothetical protein
MFVVMLIIATLVAIVAGAFFYRIGGMSKEEAKKKFPWWPQSLVRSWVRDCFCSLISTAWMVAFFPKDFGSVWYWVAVAITWGWTWGMLTTYWDGLFGYDNYFMHGGMIALAALPFPLYFQIVGGTTAGMWVGFGIRIVVTAGVMGLICLLTDKVDIEECGRGATQQAFLPFMVVWR